MPATVLVLCNDFSLAAAKTSKFPKGYWRWEDMLALNPYLHPDAFTAAFRIPNFLNNLFGEGAVLPFRKLFR